MSRVAALVVSCLVAVGCSTTDANGPAPAESASPAMPATEDHCDATLPDGGFWFRCPDTGGAKTCAHADDCNWCSCEPKKNPKPICTLVGC